MIALPLLNLENVSEEEAAQYKVREAARAVVTDVDSHIAILHATKNHYYKLPGGGVEAGETIAEALLRECREEIGCNIAVTAEVASLTEYRKKFKLKQISYCYIAHVVGEKGVPQFEPDEVAEGFQVVWLPISEALRLIKVSEPTIYQGPYMVQRDTALLEAARDRIHK